MRSLTVVGIILGVLITLGLGYFLGQMDLASPYAVQSVANHKGNEEWPLIPIGLVIILVSVSTFGFAMRRKLNQKTDKVMFSQNEMTEYKPLAHRDRNQA